MYIVVKNFVSKTSRFSCKNVVYDLTLKHCYLNVLLDLEI